MNIPKWRQGLIILTLGLLVIWPTAILAADKQTVLKIPELQIKLPGLLFSSQNKIQTSTDENGQVLYHIPWIAEYIDWIYNYSLGIIGLLALIAIMIGGFYWLLAGGSASRVTEAKNWISAAVTGLVLALGSYLVLVTINGQLVKLPSLKIAAVKGEDLVLVLNNNISGMNAQLGPGDYCGCFKVESLTYAASGFNSVKTCDLISEFNYSSPYRLYCEKIDSLCRTFNIDPAYVIAQWNAESSLGTAGAAKKNNNPGNFTCSRVSSISIPESAMGLAASYTCVLGSDGKHIWRKYADLEAGLTGYFISKKQSKYFSGYVRPNIYRYAPPSDGNNTNAYISTIVKTINKWSNNKQTADKTTNGSCPCLTTK